jgi:hypothetical protein
MAAPRQSVQGAVVLHQPAPHRIEADIAHQLEQVRFSLAPDGLVAILKEIPVAAVAPIKGPRVTSQDAPHDRRKRDAAGPKEQVQVIGE